MERKEARCIRCSSPGEEKEAQEEKNFRNGEDRRRRGRSLRSSSRSDGQLSSARQRE